MGQIWNDGYGGSTVGFSDPDGKIWSASGGGRGSLIGLVDADGKVWSASGGGHGSVIGFVDGDGKVYTASGGGHGGVVGRVTPDGRIWNDGYGGSIIGRVEGERSAGGALLLLGFLAASAGAASSSSSSKSSGPGWLAIFAFFLRTWQGRIGVLYGLAFGILVNKMNRGGTGTAIFLSIFSMVICGLLGRLIGFISSKLSRYSNVGALIGSGVTGIALAVVSILGEMNDLSSVLLFFIVGAVPGLVAGAIVGGIVGLVTKKN